MQTTADFIRTLVELTTCVEDGHHNLKGTLMQLFVHINRDTTTVIFNGNGVILVYRNFDIMTVARHGLVDRIINGLVYQVMESLFTDVTNVHSRTLAHCLQAFQDLNVTGRVIILVFWICRHCCF